MQGAAATERINDREAKIFRSDQVNPFIQAGKGFLGRTLPPGRSLSVCLECLPDIIREFRHGRAFHDPGWRLKKGADFDCQSGQRLGIFGVWDPLLPS
jgi:hypothetical protein